MASQFGLGQPKPVSCALGSHLESFFPPGNCVLISKARLQRSQVREGGTMNVARRKNFRVSDGSYDSRSNSSLMLMSPPPFHDEFSNSGTVAASMTAFRSNSCLDHMDRVQNCSIGW